MNHPDALEREILRPLWKVHILHHAQKGPIVGHWMMEELREHGYSVSPGTLYPLLARMEKLGWLTRDKASGAKGSKEPRPYRATSEGKKALREVEARLRELVGEVHLKKQGKPAAEKEHASAKSPEAGAQGTRPSRALWE